LDLAVAQTFLPAWLVLNFQKPLANRLWWRTDQEPSARLAAEYVANQPGDGYTLLASPVGPMSMAAAIFPDLKYDPINSFVPLAMIGQFPPILVVRSDTPVTNVSELVQFSEVLSYAGAEVGGMLPPEIQLLTIFSIGIRDKNSEPAEALVRFLTTPAVAPVIQLKGLEPL
jgi:Tripartite tricarboxylate transporter family receptor